MNAKTKLKPYFKKWNNFITPAITKNRDLRPSIAKILEV